MYCLVFFVVAILTNIFQVVQVQCDVWIADIARRNIFFVMHNVTRLIYVAPHAGAWVEIIQEREKRHLSLVAPHAGAWVEICITFAFVQYVSCRSPRGSVG